MKKNLVYIGNHLRSSNKNPTYSLELISRLRTAGFGVVETSSKPNKVLRYLDMWATLLKNRRGCDYIIIDTYSTQNFYYAITLAWWARRFGLKYIPVLHGGNLPQRLKTNPQAIKKYCAGAYKIVSPSAYLANEFNRAGIDNIEIIPNAIDLKTFAFRQEFKNRQRLIWLRSFKEVYNPLLAIKAFKLVAGQFPKATLTMAGPAEAQMLKACKDLAANFNLSVEFKGKQSRTAWVQLAAGCDIFINSSNFDNMPLSVVEAMAMGLAVVSTDVGGMPYLIDDAKDGLLVRRNDAEEMAAAIAKLLRDTDFTEKLAINARSKVSHYNWDAIVDQWEAVLN